MALKAKKAPPQIIKKTVKVLKKAVPVIHGPKVTLQPRPVANGIHRKDTTPRLSTTPASSRHASKEPVERIKKERAKVVKRPSPAASTPHFTSSDDEEEEDEQPKKRQRLGPKDIIDPNRRVRDLQAFSEVDGSSFDVIHAADIANSTITEHSRDKYEAFFTALAGHEDECPTIELQYPSASQRERYDLVKPTDKSDFKPITEIFENMRIVAEHYLDDTTSEKIFCEEDGSGIYQKLHRALRDGEKSRVGAQSRFIDLVNEYNTLLSSTRKDGTISRQLDSMTSISLKLVEHIIKGQIYARTVSPQVHIVRQYEGFSDNVYGELLPMFLSRIFKETRLKSNQIFVDLGSGVGNCVLQAALETGCESWGCEMMDNPHKLAELQAREFPARCRLWGIKPGPIRLIHDDFLKNEEIGEILKRADVILINNQAFTAELNDKLKYKFLDLKEGAQIISLKYFRDPGHKIKESNMENPVNVLTVREMERFSGMVSWSDDPGKWYLQVKDGRELEAFGRRMVK
jgi:[histone H3]-lysine79 N-trimethyltransferase